MNILYISQYFSFKPKHAAAVTTYEIVKRLSEKGHTVTVLVPNVDPEESRNINSKELLKFQVHPLSHFPHAKVQKSTLLRFWTISLWYVFLVLWILKGAQKKKYEIVIAMYHSNHLATASAYIVSRILKLPLIVKEHDLIPEFEDPKILRRLLTRFLMAVNLPIIKRSEVVLVLGNDRKEMVHKFYGIVEKKLVLFPNGVDPHNFTSNSNRNFLSEILGLELEDCRILLYVGALTKNRGLENLVIAMPLILEKHPQTKLIVVGEGPERERLINLATQQKVNGNIKFIGNIEHCTIPNLISSADVTIGPLISSIPNSTSFPIKVLEYMACGKPVVGSFGGVSNDLIINGYNGILVREGDTLELAAAIFKLFNDAFAKEIGQNARKHVENFHDWNNLILRLDKIIKAQVARSHRKAG